MDNELKIEIVKEGDGKTFPVQGSRVTLHFTSSFEHGKKIDSSRDRNYPYVFIIGKGAVIKGWEQGILKLSLGQRAILTCPPEYAYGANGIRGIIPGNTTLVFDVEILKIN